MDIRYKSKDNQTKIHTPKKLDNKNTLSGTQGSPWKGELDEIFFTCFIEVKLVIDMNTKENKEQQMRLVFCLSKIAILPHIKQICIDFKVNDFYTKCFRDSPYFSKINYCLNSDPCELLPYCTNTCESHKLTECLFLY